ncbi:EAL domain-containing protein [Thiohalospira sp.]|uniref:EAL domain-containing protein n=1 Tax=Thiohalospira sp. TaxID=3080549 RepID=UPI0039800D5B
MSVNRTQLALGLGFMGVLALMALLVLVALSRMGEIHQRLETIVEHHNTKQELVQTLYTTARERIITLQRLINETDRFAQEERHRELLELASRFVQARSRLQTMALDPVEERLLSAQGEATGEVRPLHQRALEMALEGERDAARRLTFNRGLPGQDEVLSALEQLSEHQDAESRRALDSASGAYAEAWWLLLGGGGAALLLGGLIAAAALYRVNRSQRELEREKERVQTTLHSIGDGVVTTDAGGVIDYMNPAAEELLGIRAGEALARPLEAIFALEDESTGRRLDHPVREAMRENSTLCSALPAALVRPDGRHHPIEHTAAPIHGQAGRVVGAVLIFRDVGEVRRLSRQLSYQASHDALTGLINRREFENRLQNALESAHNEGEEHALCYLDLDQFKLVNDTCGHAAGDELLKQLAERIRGRVRASDTVARLGGDEFGVLLESCPPERARTIAEELRETVRVFRFVWDNQSFEVGVSIGLVPIDSDSGGLVGLLAAADAACYVAKDHGRDRIHIYHSEDADLERHHGEMEWAQRLRLALDEDQFCLYHQPFRTLNPALEGDTGFSEVLLRLRQEGGEIVPPMAFIPAAERYNLMPAIDYWVVDRVIRQLESRSTPFGARERVSVNLSGQSLSEPATLDRLLKRLDASTADPKRLCFEITETAAVANLTAAGDFIGELRQRGCCVALDDFGSGLSSFAYLKHMPVDLLKIDGSFIRDMLADPTDRAFVESINQIGHIMGIRTVAEFVESDALMEALQAMGVDYAQGFAIAHPTPLQGIPLPAGKVGNGQD